MLMYSAELLKWKGYFQVLFVLAAVMAAHFLLVMKCASVLKLLVVICLLLLARVQPLA